MCLLLEHDQGLACRVLEFLIRGCAVAFNDAMAVTQNYILGTVWLLGASGAVMITSHDITQLCPEWGHGRRRNADVQVSAVWTTPLKFNLRRKAQSLSGEGRRARKI